MKKPTVPDGLSCKTCRFWVDQTSSEDEVEWGFCRALPPTVVGTGDPEVGVQCVDRWTELPYWCGAHQQRLQ